MQIGNYVHYRFSNYQKYGLGFNSGSSPNPNIVFKNQKNQILSSLPNRNGSKEAIRKNLETQLNFFFNLGDAKAVSTGFTSEDQNRLKEKVIEICKQAMSSLNIDLSGVKWDTLSATGGGSVTIGENDVSEFKKIRATQIGGEKSGSTYSAVMRRLQELIALRDKLSTAATKSAADIKFINSLDKLEKDYASLITEIQNRMTAQGLSIHKGRGYNALKGQFKFKDLEGSKGFATEIQNLVNLSKQVTDTEVVGYLGEYVPAVSQYVANLVAEKGLTECLQYLNSPEFNIDIITGKIIGNVRSRKVLQKSAVINKKGGGSSSTDAEIGDVKVRTNYTQDKVDVVLDLPDEQKINASMKNINMFSGKDIHVLSGTSTLNFLQDYPRFANHYLNITANVNRNYPGDTKPSAGLLAHAHNMMKLTIALYALTGGVWGETSSGIARTQQAEILVVNNSAGTRGNFKVYFMRDLIDKISKNIDLIKIDGFETVRQYDNTWIGELKGNTQEAYNRASNNKAAFKRVANILAQLHTEKLKVSLSLDALT